MSRHPPPTFNDSSLRKHLVRNGFSEAEMQVCSLDNGLTVPLVAFSHRPCDTRTACVSAILTSDSLLQDLHNTRKTGAPLVFVQMTGHLQWDVWFHKGETAERLWPHERGSLDEFFKAHKDQVTPEAIFRAKTLGRHQSQQQLTFVDAGTLETVEAEAGDQLCRLIERMMRATSQRLHMGSVRELDEKTAQWLVKANFWLLAARLLQDKNVSNFRRLDLLDIETTFTRVTKHYGATMEPLSKNRREALVHAAEELKRHSPLSLVSTETLAHVYENALITPQTRKELGTHSTPSWLVDYIFSRLAPWIEAMPADQRHVYEPTCGHAPFLLGALRLLSADKHCTKLSDTDRHAWLKQRLRGSEIDDFAREVARLSLTLADIPNPNGWSLDEGDLFQGNQLETRIRDANIIVANPPFEAKSLDTHPNTLVGDLSHVSRAAELLRRISVAARPGTAVGLVVPQTLLDSPKLNELRATLQSNFEWSEILRLPDKDVFKIADVESAVMIGRRVENPTNRSPTIFKNISEGDVVCFAREGIASSSLTCFLDEICNAPSHSMFLPDMAETWRHLSQSCASTLGQLASISKGFDFKASLPRTTPKISSSKRTGYELGLYNLDNAPDTHKLPRLVWMNRNESVIATKRSGFAGGIPQIVLNYARISRGHWRLAAYMDTTGHPATSRFLIVRPYDTRHSLLFMWAFLNSPIANAYSKAFSGKRDILAGTMRRLPLPVPSDAQLHEIESAARDYLKACASAHTSQDAKRQRRNSVSKEPELPGLVTVAADVPAPMDSSHLRELHWHMDAAVLRLYKLPPKLERRLLDYFSGHRRERVPFEQTEYISSSVPELETIDQLLAVTADWETHNERRSALIDKEYEGHITAAELSELESLQKLASLRRDLVAPLPLAELEAEVERLKREGKWE